MPSSLPNKTKPGPFQVLRVGNWTENIRGLSWYERWRSLVTSFGRERRCEKKNNKTNTNNNNKNPKKQRQVQGVQIETFKLRKPKLFPSRCHSPRPLYLISLTLPRNFTPRKSSDCRQPLRLIITFSGFVLRRSYLKTPLLVKVKKANRSDFFHWTLWIETVMLTRTQLNSLRTGSDTPFSCMLALL